ncbi:MAG: YciI family protein [Acidimicrobiales bacterium]
MKYVLILAGNPLPTSQPQTAAFGPYMDEWAAYSQALAEAGAMVTGEVTAGAETASTVRVRDGKRIVTDGPFIESKEVIGGYYVIDVANSTKERSIGPPRSQTLTSGAVEVRPVPGNSS